GGPDRIAGFAIGPASGGSGGRPPGEQSTGQHPVFSHALTSACAHSGGSVIDRNAPPDTVMIVWAATRAAGSAWSRLAMGVSAADSFVTMTASRAACQGPGTGVARIATDPASGARRRTTRPSGLVS